MVKNNTHHGICTLDIHKTFAFRKAVSVKQLVKITIVSLLSLQIPILNNKLPYFCSQKYLEVFVFSAGYLNLFDKCICLINNF